jgi:hypothetical protein
MISTPVGCRGGWVCCWRKKALLHGERESWLVRRWGWRWGNKRGSWATESSVMAVLLWLLFRPLLLEAEWKGDLRCVAVGWRIWVCGGCEAVLFLCVGKEWTAYWAIGWRRSGKKRTAERGKKCRESTVMGARVGWERLLIYGRLKRETENSPDQSRVFSGLAKGRRAREGESARWRRGGLVSV